MKDGNCPKVKKIILFEREFYMKNIGFCLVLVFSFFVLFACGGTPPPAPAASPSSSPEAPPSSPEVPPSQPSSPAVAPPERAHDLVLDGAEIYTVIHRDTLSHIARIKYGAHNGFYYPLIIMASRDLVEDQDYIEIGMVLTIPNLQANLNDARARASMKAFFLEVADITNRKRPKDAAGLRSLAGSW
jgi:hypothetical protein